MRTKYKRILKKNNVNVTKDGEKGRITITSEELSKFIGQKFDIIIEKSSRKEKVTENAN